MLRRAHFVTRRKYVAALGTEVAAPLLRLVARMHAGRPPVPPSGWRRGLIIGHTHIGDVLYRTPSLAPLRAALPECEWDMLAAPLSAPVLRGNPHLRDVLGVNTGDATWTLAPGAFAAMRARRYDVALCTNSHSIHQDLLLAAALAIPSRVAFAHKGMSGLVTHRVPPRFPDTFPGYVRHVVAHALGLAPDWDLTPEIFLDAADEREAARVVAEEGLGGGPAPLAFTITGRQRAPWPPGVLLAVARELQAALNAPVVLCGGPGEAEPLRAAARAANLEARVLAGRLSLRGFAAFLRRCRLLVAYDSGPRHVGNAVRVPVAFAPNLGARRAETGRYCDNEVDLGPDDELVSPERVPAVLAAYPPGRMVERALAHLAAREAMDASGARAGREC